MLECHHRFCWRKTGFPAKPTPRAKHPCKVHVWAGITCSCQEKTPIVVFEALMNVTGLIDVCKAGLVPYLNEVNNNPCLMQDDDRSTLQPELACGLNEYQLVEDPSTVTRLEHNEELMCGMS